MSLKEWADNGWLKPHKTTRKQICDLFAIVERDIESAGGEGISPDWQFAIAYNAALKLCTILLYSEGYRPEISLAHFRTLQALRLVLGDKYKSEVDYLDECRVKRNKAEYDSVGIVDQEEARELLTYAVELKRTVLEWLSEEHRALVP